MLKDAGVDDPRFPEESAVTTLVPLPARLTIFTTPLE
jgi:hypothetical protein